MLENEEILVNLFVHAKSFFEKKIVSFKRFIYFVG